MMLEICPVSQSTLLKSEMQQQQWSTHFKFEVFREGETYTEDLKVVNGHCDH